MSQSGAGWNPAADWQSASWGFCYTAKQADQQSLLSKLAPDRLRACWNDWT
jgi:hypothetical protein